ncbi:helix-turn-helix domain-containing protein [Terrimonas alba]|uniref:helix-turn-helix domain-containing protein n=1 Tax=Terrimonas alba TaxID=3349636 RepID=UPI0035F2F907
MLNFYDHVRAHPEQLKQFSCKDLLFLINECPPEFKKGEEWAEHNVFIYVMTGRHNLYSREHEWYLKAGSTMFVKKGGLGVERVDDDSFCALMFYVPDKYICSFVRENIALFPPVDLAMLSAQKVLPVHTTEVMEAFYQSVLAYFSLTTQPPENLVELKFRELLLHIITNKENRELTAYFYRLAMTGMDDLQEIMETNCLYNLQLQEYARLCHRSLSTFKRDFQARFGNSPGRWLLEKRLGAAAKLLKQPGMQVMDVAQESGFKNIAHFDKVFKKQFGQSPLQYRKQFFANSISLS